MYKVLLVAILLQALFLVSPVYAGGCDGTARAESSGSCGVFRQGEDEGPSLFFGNIININSSELGIPDVEMSDFSSVEKILSTVFVITGALATVYLMVGGLRYVLAAGNPDKIKQAKDTILYAVVGLLVSIFAFSIVIFVIGAL